MFLQSGKSNTEFHWKINGHHHDLEHHHNIHRKNDNCPHPKSAIATKLEDGFTDGFATGITTGKNTDGDTDTEPGIGTCVDIYKLKRIIANTLSVMTNVLRNVVSKQRIRYKEKGFNLDLAYISDKIIAMGYPADNLESFYRNPLEDVYKFLEENHHDHYKIYNLCLERSYDINKFHGRVAVYPFEDHNPPTIELILKFCDDLDSWLKADIMNVAAVHCKAGKGRTGTMICCYLLYSGQQGTAENALACYDEKRTKDRKGVTIPSQRRYVQYFSSLVRSGSPYERRTLQLCEIRFTEASQLQSQGTAHCSISVLQDTPCAVRVQPLQNFIIDFRKTFILDIRSANVFVAGDTKIELTHKTKKYFHLWFNTFFVSEVAVAEGEGDDTKLVYTLSKCEIDDVHKDKEHKYYPEDFKVHLVFTMTLGGRMLSEDSSQRIGKHNSNSSADNQRDLQSGRTPNNHTRHALPPNNSSGSELNYICDQKSSSSASISSLGFVIVGAESKAAGPADRSTYHNINANASARTHLYTQSHSQDYSQGRGFVVQTHAVAPQNQPQAPPPPLPLSPPTSYAEFNDMSRTNSAHQLQQQHEQQNPHNHHYNNARTSAAITSTPNQRKHQQHKGGATVSAASADATPIAGSVGIRRKTNAEDVYQCREEAHQQHQKQRQSHRQQQKYQPSVSVVAKMANNMAHAASSWGDCDAVATYQQPETPQRVSSKESNNYSSDSRSNKSSSISSHSSSSSACASASVSTSISRSASTADNNEQAENDNVDLEDDDCECEDAANGDEVQCDSARNVDEYDEDWESGESPAQPIIFNALLLSPLKPSPHANNRTFSTPIAANFTPSSSTSTPPAITIAAPSNSTTSCYTSQMIDVPRTTNTNTNNDTDADLNTQTNTNISPNSIRNMITNMNRTIDSNSNSYSSSKSNRTCSNCLYAKIGNGYNDDNDGNDDDNHDDDTIVRNLKKNRPITITTVMAAKDVVPRHWPNIRTSPFLGRNSFKTANISVSGMAAGIGEVANVSANASVLMSGVAQSQTATTDTSIRSSSCSGFGVNCGSSFPMTSKQKLKVELKKNKLKLSKKFAWFNSYFRSDPVEFCENFVQQTTTVRRSSSCSVSSRTLKPSTMSPPPSSEQISSLQLQGAAQPSLETHNAALISHIVHKSLTTSSSSLATTGDDKDDNGDYCDHCEDYYSSMCDKQLSVNNSPCKSPRSFVDVTRSSARVVVGSGTHGVARVGASAKLMSAAACSALQSLPCSRQLRVSCEKGCTRPRPVDNDNDDRSNVVIVAAKPAKVHAIGFTVAEHRSRERALNVIDPVSYGCCEEDKAATAFSIYCTPPPSLSGKAEAKSHTASPFEFTKIVHEINKLADDVFESKESIDDTPNCRHRTSTKLTLHPPQNHLRDDMPQNTVTRTESD